MVPETKEALGAPIRPKPADGNSVESSAVDMVDLKRKSVRGGAVTMVSQAITIAIQLTSTVVLARLLSADDYGVMAMVMAVTGFAGLFRDLGLSSAAIQKKDLIRAQQSNLFWLNVAMGTLLTVLVAAGAPLVALFYGRPELTAVTLALSASFLIGSFGTQHGAMLVREMQFGRQAVASIGGAIVGLIVSISLAFSGFSYWSLVWGNLSGGLCTTILLFTLSPFRPELMSKGSGIRDMLKFGANVTAFDFVNYFARNLDNIIIGRFWGAAQLGLYSRAYQLLMFPISAIRGPIMAVAFPAMSSLQDRSELFRNYYLKTVWVTSLLTMPIVGLLYINSAPLVEIALGKQWLGVADLFQILAVTAFIQTPLSLNGTIQLASGRSGRYVAMGSSAAGVTSLGFLIGVKWGAAGVAIAYATTTYLLLIPMLLWAFRDTTIRLWDFFSEIAHPAVSSCFGVVTAVAVLSWTSPSTALSGLLIGGSAFFAGLLPWYLASSRVRRLLTSAALEMRRKSPMAKLFSA